MRRAIAALLALGAAACNQTAQTEAPVAVSTARIAPAPAPAQALAPAEARLAAAGLPSDEEIAPLYEPLVDMHRVKPEQYRKDIAECRQQAAPQEAAARRASQQQQTGTAIAVAGTLASFIPVPGFRQAHALAGAANAVQSVGGATAEGGAAALDQATNDYALVVNSCLTHKRYRLLRV